MLDEMKCGIKEYDWPDWWYFGKERRFLHAPEEDEDLEHTHQLFAQVGNESYPETDISAEQWLRNKGVNDKILAIADACYANDFGCSLHQLGLRDMITENRKWDSGDSYLVLDCPLSELVRHIASELSTQIHCNSPVSRIDHDHKGALVRLYGGRQIRCQHVLVTVPITVLQREDITFSPPLPQLKQQAIQRVKMSNAIKVVMMFAHPFWPADFFDVVCTDSFIPEFWVTSPPAVRYHQASKLNSTQDVSTSQHTTHQESVILGSSSTHQEPGGGAVCGPEQGAAKDLARAQHECQQAQHNDPKATAPDVEVCQAQQASSNQESSGNDAPQQQQQQQQQSMYCMVGFVAGSKAEEISKMRQNSVVIKSLSQLDQMFGTKQQQYPATSSFLHAHIVDWSREKHIHGAYTYPTLHAQVGDRDVLAEPIGTTVFFAGEATHAAINPCMQAAMETGQRAATQIIAAKNASAASRL